MYKPRSRWMGGRHPHSALSALPWADVGEKVSLHVLAELPLRGEGKKITTFCTSSLT